MKTASFGWLIKKSIGESYRFLFRPFLLKKWFALTTVALFAGVLSSSFSFGIRERVTPQSSEHRTGVFQKIQPEAKISGLPPLLSPNSNVHPFDWVRKVKLQDFGSTVKSKASAFLESGFGKAVVIILILMFVIAPWFAAHFSFVWFYDILNKQIAIREPFEKFKIEGDSFFRMSLAMNFLFSALIAGSAVLIGFSIQALFGALEIPILILTLIIICLSLFYWVARDFVVPIMAADRINFKKAWGKFSVLYEKNRLEFWNYFLLNICLSSVIGVFKILVGAIWMLTLIATAGILYLIPFLIFNVIFIQLEFVFWCYAIAVGVPFLIFAVVSSFAVHLPFATFHRFFSIYFLSSLASPYQFFTIEKNEN